jgi:hypothetical protein
MACIISTLVADDVINTITEEICCFTFSFVAPLRAE